MTRCKLDLALDVDRSRPLRPGDHVAGLLGVDVDRSCRCRKLTVELRWRTHGRGNTTRGPAQPLVLDAGTWEPGEHKAYPIELVVPDGPSTYHGTLLNIDYYVTATADLAWAFDPEAEEDLIVDASGLSPYPHGPLHHPGFQRSGVGGMIGMVVLGLVLIGVGGGTAALGILGVAENVMGLLCMTPFGLLFFGIGVKMAYGAVASRLAELTLGAVAIDVPPVVHAGAPCPVTVRFRPRRGVTLNGLEVTLICEEVVVSGSGTNRTTHRHEVWRDATTLASGQRFEAGQAVTLDHTFSLPDDAAPSFAASDNALRWRVVVAADIPLWPDWSEEHVLTVAPVPS